MLSKTNEVKVTITAKLGENPRYAGSIHDDASAKNFGYERALVPGAFLYGYMSRLAVATWEIPWLTRGTMRSYSRRPVFDGEEVVITATAIREDDQGLHTEMVVHNRSGQEVASGAASLPHQAPPPPDLADFPIMPLPEPPPVITAGGMPLGIQIGSDDAILSPAEHLQSLRDFGETWEPYFRDGIVHAGYLLRRGVSDGVRSFKNPTPGIYVSGWGQHYAVAYAGQRLVSAGRVTNVYERKGHHYFDSEQVLIGPDNKLIAHYRRSSIYVVRQQAA